MSNNTIDEMAVELYARWVVLECRSQLDEIEHLVNMLLESDKRDEIIKDIKFVVE